MPLVPKSLGTCNVKPAYVGGSLVEDYRVMPYDRPVRNIDLASDKRSWSDFYPGSNRNSFSDQSTINNRFSPDGCILENYRVPDRRLLSDYDSP